jgi:hypothetical protein
MSTYCVFQSATDPDLRGFTDDPTGERLPREHGPWTLVQQVGLDTGILGSDFERLVTVYNKALAQGQARPISAVQRDEAEASSRESEQPFQKLLEAFPAAVYTTDAAGRITFYNEAAVKLSGHQAQLGTDQWCVTWRLYWPDGTPCRTLSVPSLGEITELIDDLVLSCRRALIAPLCCSAPHLLLGSEPMILWITGASFVLPDLVGPFLYSLHQVFFHRSAPGLATDYQPLQR